MDLKEAKERLKLTSKQCHENKECWDTEFCGDCYMEIETVFAIDRVLQELDNLQKENEKYISGELMTRNQAKHFEEINKKYYIHKDKIREKIEKLKNEISYIGGECDEGCNKCFDKDWNPLYRGAEFRFCYAYYQIKLLQDLLKEE